MHRIIDSVCENLPQNIKIEKQLDLIIPPMKADAITSARILHIDGCDTAACAQAAKFARKAGIPVVADLDTVYKDVEKIFPLVDYLIASANFLPAVTGHNDPFRVYPWLFTSTWTWAKTIILPGYLSRR